jgi:surfactin synthase thioesterase subunit
MSAVRSSWLMHRLNPSARLRLFCLPYAGGGASIYRSWQARFPPGIEVCSVQLPGRENRLMEPPFSKMAPLVEALAEGLLGALDRPFALFGHSMGALIGYELAKLLRQRHRIAPQHLFISACHAPEFPDAKRWHDLSEQELMAEMRQVPGFPAEVLEHAELMRIVLPVIRADAEVTETYAYRPAEPLEIPFTVFASERDELIPRPSVDPWRAHTRAAFELYLVEGHHLYIQEQAPRMIQVILEKLRGAAAAR